MLHRRDLINFVLILAFVGSIAVLAIIASAQPVLTVFCAMLIAGVFAWYVQQQERRPHIRDQRRSAGCCPECGYDLRASPGDTCPECGAPIERVK